MANINNLKIGSSDPDRIMYGSRHSSPDIFYKFTEWKLNPSYKNVVEVTDEKIIIKKFKPNVWIIHSPEVNGPFAKAICKYCNGFRANITGLNAHLSILSTEYHTFSNHGAGNDTPKFRGLCMYPMYTDGIFINQSCFAWESCWDSPDTRNLPPISDYPAFRLDSVNGHGSFGLFHDKEDFIMFPDDLYDINSWSRGQNVKMCYGLMIATGKVESFDINSWSTYGSGKIVDGKIVYSPGGRDSQGTDQSIRKWSNITEFKVKITGLSEGDYVLYGQLSKLKDESATKFTTDGEYTIPSGWGGGSAGYGFSVRGTGNSQVTIETVNPLVDKDGLIDISDNPIIIEQINNEEVDLTSQECWDIMIGDDCVYHKDKTYENCWGEYGLVKPENLLGDTKFDDNPNIKWISPIEFQVDAPIGQSKYESKLEYFSEYFSIEFLKIAYYIDLVLPPGITATYRRYINDSEGYSETFTLKNGRNHIPEFYKKIFPAVGSKDNSSISYRWFELTLENNTGEPSKVIVKFSQDFYYRKDLLGKYISISYHYLSDRWNKYGYRYIKLPDVVDYDDPVEMNKIMSFTRWNNCNPKNITFWDKIKKWFSENPSGAILCRGEVFKNSNIDTIDIVLDNIKKLFPEDHFVGDRWYGEDNFNDSWVHTINFIKRDRSVYISSPQRFLRNAKNLKTITVQFPEENPDDFIMGANSIVDGFSGTQLETFPERLICWGAFRNYNGFSVPNTISQWAFLHSKKLKVIPAYPSNDPNFNTLVPTTSLENFIGGCESLTDVGFILDAKLVIPKNSRNMCFGCTKLSNIKIKNLNNGDWHFESESAFNGYLPALSLESVEYLIDNLTDLTTYDPEKQENNQNKSFFSWESDYKGGEIIDYVSYQFYKMDQITLRKRFSNPEEAAIIVQTNLKLTNMKLVGYNFQKDDELLIGTESQPDLYKITSSNSSVTINKPDNSVIYIKFINRTNPSYVTDAILKIVDGWDSTNPLVDHATLYGPSQWNDKITSEMVTSARQKGWTLNIGGSIK